MRNINWKRLARAAKETALQALALSIFAVLFVAPAVLAVVTHFAWWLIIYPIIIFVGETLDKYRGY